MFIIVMAEYQCW